MVRRVLFAAILLVPLPLTGKVQGPSRQQAVVSLPQGALTRIPSPNGKWTLIFECPNECADRKLWIEERASRTRRFVKEYERDLEISWTPDSRFFFVNDEYGSDGSRCYVYDAVDLKVTDMAALLASGNSDATKFLKAGHSYLKAKSWISLRELLVILYGHFDNPPPKGFTIRYRVALIGRVQKLSQDSEEKPQ